MNWLTPLERAIPEAKPDNKPPGWKRPRPITVCGRTYRTMMEARDRLGHSTTKLYAMVKRGEAVWA